MFGMGFTEILFIAVIAILFLGPDKLPDAMVQIAKLFKSIKSTVNDAKSSFEEEIHIKELREEALNYRKQLDNVSNDISGFKNSIPNPAAELQSAVTSIGGDRYLDEDILTDIEEAENKTEIQETESSTQKSKEKTSVDKPEKKPKKKTPKKSSPKNKKMAKKETEQKTEIKENNDAEEKA